MKIVPLGIHLAVKFVAASAAVLGQGGEHHLNEQPHDYWRDMFLQRGFALIDGLRPRQEPGRRALLPL